jgi:iron complex outermembrane receptor protein
MSIMPALLAGLLFQQPPAQTQPVQDSLVVTGTYQPIPLNESDRSVTLLPLTPKTVLLYNTVNDLFKLDPSLDLQQRAPNNIQGDLSIRGGTFGQTLVLLNGMRLNDAQSGHHDLDIPVPLGAIQQIEILRGSGSTQYGADALGGVVNVVTRRPEGLEADLRAALGNFGINQEALTLGGGTKKYSELLSLSRDFSTGFIADRDYRNLSASSSTMLTSPLGPATILLAMRDTPFGANLFYGNYDSWERTREWFAAGHQNIFNNTEVDFAFKRHSDLFVLFRERPQVYTNRHADETYEGSVRRTDNLPLGAKLHYGTEIDVDTIESNNLGLHRRRREGAFVDYDLRILKRYSFNVGLRDDIYSGLHNQLSPNASGAAWINDHLKLRAAVSGSFRLPTYTDLYYADPATLGNASLKPETAWNYEGGADWRATSRFDGALTVFNRHDTNVIDYVQSQPAAKFVAMNVQKIIFTGFEANLQYTVNSHHRIKTSYTFLHGSEAPVPGTVSRYVFNYPSHSAVATWEADLPFGLIARTRLGALQRFQQGPYGLWDASIASARGRFRPFLQLTNVTDTNYHDLPKIVQPGRSVVAGVNLKLGRIL